MESKAGLILFDKEEFPFTNGHFLFGNNWTLTFTKNKYNDDYMFIVKRQREKAEIEFAKKTTGMNFLYSEILVFGFAKKIVDTNLFQIAIPFCHCTMKCPGDICRWTIACIPHFCDEFNALWSHNTDEYAHFLQKLALTDISKFPIDGKNIVSYQWVVVGAPTTDGYLFNMCKTGAKYVPEIMT